MSVRSSLHEIINTKEKADIFMKLLKQDPPVEPKETTWSSSIPLPDRKLSLAEFIAWQEADPGETIEDHLAWAQRLLDGSVKEPFHDGDCNNNAFTCCLCLLQRFLEEYGEYCWLQGFIKKDGKFIK